MSGYSVGGQVVQAEMPVPVTVPALVTIPNVDLVAAGEWDLSTGPATFTTQDLADAVDATQCPAVGSPVIKLGHVDRRFDGEPAIGRVRNMALASDGNKLIGDLAGMPGWLAVIAESAYPQRSVEGCWGFTCQIGHTHPFVITALALLGVSSPGVGVLGGLDHVAALYGVAAAAEAAAVTWRTQAGGAMPRTANAQAAITVDDVRKAYYDNAPMSYWITELQMDPTQLIVCDDASGEVMRVPFTIKGTTIDFGQPVKVEVVYEDIKAMAALRGPGTLVAYASAADSRGGLAVPEAEPPEGEPAASADAASSHGPYTGTHSHMHSAMGSQGGDATHDHSHTHAGDASHSHAHAGAGPNRKGAADVELSDAQKAQIRAALGLGDNEEVTAEHVMAMAAKVTAAATPAVAPSAEPETEPEPVAASVRTALPPGVVAVDRDVWEATQQRIRQGEEARREQLNTKMETSITAAVQAGKFPVARADHWRRLYARDPEGTEMVLAGLTAGVVPTQDIGVPGGPMAAAEEADYEHLFPPAYKRTAQFHRD